MPNKFKHNLEARKSIYLHTVEPVVWPRSYKKYILFKKVKNFNVENEVRMNLRSSLKNLIRYEDHFPVRIQNPNLIRIDPSLRDEWMLLCVSCAACLWNV